MIPVILSGGSGTRLWPSSRKQLPKQFSSFVGEQTMLQSTYTRLKGSSADNQAIIVCNHSHQYMVKEQLSSIGVEIPRMILEPAAKNTAPAVALSALRLLDEGEDSTLLVLPADHVITDIKSFHQALLVAEKAADNGDLVTFGIVPNQPITGYGYVKTAGMLSAVMPVEAFIEKPTLEKAESYVGSGKYFWNSGIFAFKASVYLSELEKYCPEILSVCKKAYKKSQNKNNVVDVDSEIFSSCIDESIDYAVMEKTKKAVLVPMDAGWSDVGTWSSLWDVSKKDDKGNAIRGDVVVVDSENNFIQNDTNLIAAIGVNNLIVVETDDAILISNKSKVQDVKKLVGELKNDCRKETESHKKIHKPWGFSDSLASESRFQVKHVTVNKGQKLLSVRHHHRAEHWIVVKGTALVSFGSERKLLTENESTFIPIGVDHSLENPGSIPLEIIEVLAGSYIGDDDTVQADHVVN